MNNHEALFPLEPQKAREGGRRRVSCGTSGVSNPARATALARGAKRWWLELHGARDLERSLWGGGRSLGSDAQWRQPQLTVYHCSSATSSVARAGQCPSQSLGLRVRSYVRRGPWGVKVGVRAPPRADNETSSDRNPRGPLGLSSSSLVSLRPRRQSALQSPPALVRHARVQPPASVRPCVRPSVRPSVTAAGPVRSRFIVASQQVHRRLTAGPSSPLRRSIVASQQVHRRLTAGPSSPLP